MRDVRRAVAPFLATMRERRDTQGSYCVDHRAFLASLIDSRRRDTSSAWT
jgi:hypothetical protein